MQFRRFLLGFVLVVAVASTLVISFAASADTTPSITASKAAQQQAMQNIEATAHAVPPAIKHPEQKPTSTCPLNYHNGIGPYVSGGPVDRSMYFASNEAEMDDANGRAFELYAGGEISQPDQGIIIMASLDPDPCAHGTLGQPLIYNVYVDPRREGTLTFTQINGDRIFYTTSTGAKGYFDVLTTSFGV